MLEHVETTNTSHTNISCSCICFIYIIICKSITTCRYDNMIHIYICHMSHIICISFPYHINIIYIALTRHLHIMYIYIYIYHLHIMYYKGPSMSSLRAGVGSDIGVMPIPVTTSTSLPSTVPTTVGLPSGLFLRDGTYMQSKYYLWLWSLILNMCVGLIVVLLCVVLLVILLVNCCVFVLLFLLLVLLGFVYDNSVLILDL